MLKPQEVTEREDCLLVESTSGVDDTIIFARYKKSVGVTIDIPWAGDSERGFGAIVSFNLDVGAARQVATFLARWADERSEDDA